MQTTNLMRIELIRNSYQFDKKGMKDSGGMNG